MKESNPHFESILVKAQELLTPENRKKVDDFLVEIGYLPPKGESNNDWSREWDIEYNKFTLALPLLKTFEEFDQFHEYVWIKMVGSNMGDSNKHLVIWENKALWLEKYEGGGLAG